MARKTYADMKAVAKATEENGNLITATLLELREALGYNRLGVRVLGYIADGLDGEGLGYFPQWVLDSDSNEAPRSENVIRVFKKGTAVGNAISAVLEPTNKGDELLRESAGGDAAETLKRVRELVAE
ncbi:hypothetical protein F1D05_36640 [Kribbella qitaiheensis]|uniref:Uncharacterized protein n=1 Tax=Kribbella qitaiheensis TaxID=1544730 RepID=A0A7G6X856_9ACTN|nr:hypothetical protein [Kribbella qitaiheensis]QNE22421.1 hypothetical protein F1D05_36640 [Kribbella qitaiheensis]